MVKVAHWRYSTNCPSGGGLCNGKFTQSCHTVDWFKFPACAPPLHPYSKPLRWYAFIMNNTTIYLSENSTQSNSYKTRLKMRIGEKIMLPGGCFFLWENTWNYSRMDEWKLYSVIAINWREYGKNVLSLIEIAVSLDWRLFMEWNWSY